MGYPEYILLVYYAISLGINLFRHGEQVRFTWRTWLANFTIPVVLAWGGFFSAFGAPQAIYITLWILVTGTAYLKQDDMEANKHNFYYSVLVVALLFGLWWWGGFFA